MRALLQRSLEDAQQPCDDDMLRQAIRIVDAQLSSRGGGSTPQLLGRGGEGGGLGAQAAVAC